MNEDLLQELFDLLPEGSFENPSELTPIIESEGVEVFFEDMPLNAFFDMEEYKEVFGELKKKENSKLPVLGKKDSVLVGEEVITDTLLDSKQPLSNIETGENKFWIEQLLGNVPIASGVADFFGDIVRAADQGLAQGASIDDAMALLTRGADTSEEDIQEYMAAVQEMDSFTESDEMKDFSRIYEQEGGGIYGFGAGIFNNPSVITQLFTSSVASMINPTVLAGAGAGAAAGAAIGSTGFAAGPLGVFSTSGGTMTGAVMGAGAALEVGLSFTEFLKEELETKGLEFSKDSVRQVLEDPKALQRIRNKSAARGAVISVIDGLTMGLAGQAGAKITKEAIKAGKAVVKSQAKGVATAAIIEGVGGSAGEAAARVAAGQEQDVAETLFEGITGQVSTVLKSGPVAAGLDLNIAKPGSFLRPSTYSINGESQTKQEIEVFIETMTPEQIRTADIKIKNDPALEATHDFLRQRAQTELTIPENIVGEDRNRMIDLEMQLSNMQDPKTENGKVSIENIKKQIREILERNGKTEAQKNREKAQGNYKKEDQTETRTKTETETGTSKDVTTETESETEVLDNPNGIELKENETIVENRDTSDKGVKRNSTIIEQTSVDKDGMKITKYESNRSDKSVDSRKPDGVSPEKALNENEEFGPNSVPEDTRVTKVFEVRSQEDGRKGADVEFQALDENGNDIEGGKFRGGVVIKEKTNAVQESSTTQVDVQESTQDSKEMGVGDSPSELAGESNIETQSEVTENEETQIENVLESPKLQEALNSESMDDSERKGVLLQAREKAIEQGQEESRLYSNIISAINREAKAAGVNANEYIQAEVIEDSLPKASRDRVNKVIDGIIEKTKERRKNKPGGGKATLAELFSNTSSYLQQSKLYEQLNDVEREAAVRELNKRLGIKEKAAPSSRKVAMGSDKKVTVNERVALKDQIKLEAKAARESASAYKKSLKNIANYVKGLKKKGVITPQKQAAILGKQANLNVFNKKSVDAFIEYVDNVFSKADLADKISKANKKRKEAKKNVGGAKTGNIPPALKTTLEEVFSISPYLVPLNKMDAYVSLIEQFGSSNKTLELEQISKTMRIAEDILNAVQEQIETNEDGSMINFEIVNKKDKTYNVDEVTGEIIENKITEEEIDNLTGEESKEVARKINKLTAEEINGLSKEKKDGSFNYGMIETLREVKNNLKNGFAPKAAFDIMTEVESNNAVKPLVPIITKIKKTSVYRHLRSFSSTIKTKIKAGSPSGDNFILDRVRSMPAFFVDDVVGNFNGKDVYNATFKKMAVAYSSFETEVKRLRALVDEADSLLEYDGLKARKTLRIGRSRNKVVKAKYKLMLLQLTKEHVNNYITNDKGEYVGNPKAPSGEAFLDITIKEGQLSEQDKEILEQLKEEFLSGDPTADLKKLQESLSVNEKKALNAYRDINGSLGEKAVFVSSQLHGKKINLFNDYVHHYVTEKNQSNKDIVRQREEFVNAGVKFDSKALVERTDGAKPISFDPGYSAMRGAQLTLVDYYMTPTNRVVQKTINKLNKSIKDNPSATKEAKQASSALQLSMEEINGLLFDKTFTDVGFGGKIARTAQNLGYKAALSSVPRAASELIGNLLLIAKNPALAAKAFSEFGSFSNGLKDVNIAMDAMTNLKSSETSRLYDSDSRKNKYSDMGNFMETSQSSGQAVGPVQNMGNQILKLGFNQAFASVDYIATKILTTPDKAVSRPMWFGTFQAAFAEATKEYNGGSVELTVKDFEEISAGTSKYLSPEFQRAVEAATSSADKSSVTISTSSNPYNSVFKNIRRKDSTAKNIYRVANSYMANFSLFEYGTFRNALYSLVNNGDMSKTEATKMIAGVTARMSSYMVMYTLLTQLMDEELFDVKEDDREEDFEYLIARQLVGAGVSLISRGSLGNIPLIPINLGVEAMNEQFGRELRDGEEYDPYKHALVFNQLGKKDLKEKGAADQLIGLFAGPFGPAFKTLSRSVKLIQRTQTGGDLARKKAMDELTNRMAIEVAGNLGLFPFYKDYRRIMLKSMFGTKPYTPTKPSKDNDPYSVFDEETSSGDIDTWDQLEDQGYNEEQAWKDYEANSEDTWSNDDNWEE